MVSRKVLVVDDDDIIREVAKLALEVVGGWQVSTATNGVDAVTPPSGISRTSCCST